MVSTTTPQHNTEALLLANNPAGNQVQLGYKILGRQEFFCVKANRPAPTQHGLTATSLLIRPPAPSPNNPNDGYVGTDQFTVIVSEMPAPGFHLKGAAATNQTATATATNTPPLVTAPDRRHAQHRRRGVRLGTRPRPQRRHDHIFRHRQYHKGGVTVDPDGNSSSTTDADRHAASAPPGPDTNTFTLPDGHGGTTAATVTVNVAP